MRLTKRLGTVRWLLAGAALALVVVAVPAGADRPRDARAAGDAPTSWRLSKNGLGPIRVGMTIRQIEERTGLTAERGYGRRSCQTWTVTGVTGGIGLMTAYGKLVRVDVYRRPWQTKRGIRVGMKGSEVRRRHPNLRVARHPYVPPGRYLIVGGKPRRMIFETGPRGRVTSFRGGLSGPVGYIEGCA